MKNKNYNTRITAESIATNRFGYGAKGDELAAAKSNPKAWVLAQLTPVTFNSNLPTSHDVFVEAASYRKAKKLAKKNKTKLETKGNGARQVLLKLSGDTVSQAIKSDHSVSWRLFDFFSNHFSVTANGRLMVGLSATLEREAIAPNMYGKFEDMLTAVAQHPAMLIYLNNERSFGPNSRLAKKRKNKGLNENLSREILELHTLGVNGGYQQQDVTELAKAITGWSVKNLEKERESGFIFRAYGHEPGNRVLLGKSYQADGVSQGEQMLRDLARHPNTAKHISYKLAHHFVSAAPSKALLSAMEKTWRDTQGDLKEVMQSMVNHDDAWLAEPHQFKTPREFLISTLRAVPSKKLNQKYILNALKNLGQQPFNAGSPAGFSDDEADWLGASALTARVDLVGMYVGKSKRINAENVMARTLGESVSERTYNMVMRAESRQQAMTLFLMSPEFQRR